MKYKISHAGETIRLETFAEDHESAMITVSRALLNPGYLFAHQIRGNGDFSKYIADKIIDYTKNHKYKGVIFKYPDPDLENYLYTIGCKAVPDSETLGPDIRRLLRYDV